MQRTLPLAARYASEWNATFSPPARFVERNSRLTALLQKRGRQPGSVRRSMMTGVVFGRTDAEVQQNLKGRAEAQLRERGVIVGTPAAVVDQLAPLASAGVQRIMLQWLNLDDLDGLEALARAVIR
jgi:alkanesulfonate monooxygenase SsuD/methylene tetrahydromethanopterin reductase-like flavin-dependent oxidoreductase (luciferase family)